MFRKVEEEQNNKTIKTTIKKITTMADNKTTAKATEQKNAKATEQKNEKALSYEVKAKVLSVLKTEDGRMRVITDKDFITIDYKTEQPEETTSFSLHPFNLLQQVGDQIPILNMANTMAMGEQLNPQIIALCMVGADITFLREFHAKGESRKETYDAYSKDCYTTLITKVVPHISEAANMMIMQLISTKLTTPKVAIIPNPVGL